MNHKIWSLFCVFKIKTKIFYFRTFEGCNNPPSYECYDNPTCGPVKKAKNGQYALECTENEFTNQNGQWTFGHTIVFDRDSEIHSMAHAIVKGMENL